MRNSGHCIKCKGQSLWVVDRAHQPDHESSNLAWPLAVTSYGTSGTFGATGVVPPGQCASFLPNERRIDVGSFQVIICAACGYTEWYAYDIERLKDIPGVRLVGPNPAKGGPYR